MKRCSVQCINWKSGKQVSPLEVAAELLKAAGV